MPRRFAVLEMQLGIPAWFLMLSEWLVSQMPTDAGGLWAAQVFNAVPLGVDLGAGWSVFASDLLGADNGFGCMHFVSKSPADTALVDLQNLYEQPSAPNMHFDRCSEQLWEIAEAESRLDVRNALIAASSIATAGCSSVFAANGFHVRGRIGRMALSASLHLAQAMVQDPESLGASAVDAYCLQADALLAMVRGMSVPVYN